ncbi:DUF2384 domain-containing protein [Massilia sp. ST3]|nr:DUF2384 domain-containing protein [Massilia sp. ST3]
MAALRARFEQQSHKAQAYYTVMHEVRGRLGGDDAANAWMNQPLAAFDGKTPAQLVGEGRELELLAHVRKAGA